jgi:hypothetical protein
VAGVMPVRGLRGIRWVPGLPSGMYSRMLPGQWPSPWRASGLSCSGLVTTPAEVVQEGSGFGGDAGRGSHLLGADGDRG